MSARRSMMTPNQATLALIRQVVSDFVQQGRCFFALEVSEEVKSRGLKTTPPTGLGRHREMAPVVESMLATGEMTGYEAVLVPVLGGAAEAFLYQPIGTPASVTETHHNRHVNTTPPVEVQLGLATPASGNATPKASSNTPVAPPSAPAPATPSRAAALKDEIQQAGSAPDSAALGGIFGHILDS